MFIRKGELRARSFCVQKTLKKKSQHPPLFGRVRRRPLSKARERFLGASALQCKKQPKHWLN